MAKLRTLKEREQRIYEKKLKREEMRNLEAANSWGVAHIKECLPKFAIGNGKDTSWRGGKKHTSLVSRGNRRKASRKA